MTRITVRTLQIVLPVAVLGVAGLAAFTMIRSRPPVEVQVPVFTPPGVRVEEISVGDVALSVSSQGTVRPRTESQLVSEIAGRVTWVAPTFAGGGFFELGDVLVKIDPFDYKQAIVSARSQVAQTRLRLAQEEAEADVAVREWEALGRGDPRALTLREPQLQDARASVAGAEAGLERAERDLERAEIVAPYAGRIREKNVDIGQYVRVGDAVASIYAVDVAEVRLPLPDEQLAFLDLPLSYRGGPDQPQPLVTLRATFAGEAHEWQGRIVRTESEIDPVSRMVLAVAEVLDPYAPGANRRPPLAVGMYVEAEIAGRIARDVAVVPREALRGRDQVLVLGAGNRLSFRGIDILRATTDVIYVGSGLVEGELVVVSPLDTPVEGMQVQVADVEVDLRARQRGGAPAEAPPATNSAMSGPGADVEIDSSLSREEQIAAIRSRLAELQGAAGTAPVAVASSPGRGGQGQRGRGGRRGRPAATAVVPAAPPRAEAVPEPASTEPAPDPPERPADLADAVRSVAVLPFVNLTRNPSDDWISTEMMAALRTALEQTGSMGFVALGSADESMALETADARSALWLVGGGYQRVGDRLRLTARVLEVDGGRLIRSAKVDGAVDELDTLTAEMVATVRAAVDGDGSDPLTSGVRNAGESEGPGAAVEVAAAGRRSP